MSKTLSVQGVLIGALALLYTTAPAYAAEVQNYPSRPIRLVVPFPPGGGADVLGRLVAQRLSETLKQQTIVDNRGGAGGRIGVEHVAGSPPDGYTLLLAGSGPMFITPALYPKLPYNIQKDFAPVSAVATMAYVVLLHPSVPAKTVKQLIALAGAKPGSLNYASSGSGAAGHLVVELFQLAAKVRMTHIPYKGTGPAAMAVMSGEAALLFGDLLSAMSLFESGKLRAIAVTSAKRSSILSDMPTVVESGVNFEFQNLYGLLAPAATPRDIVNKLNSALVSSLQSAETQKLLAKQGSEVATNSPEALASFIRSESERYRKVIADANIKAE